MTVIGPGGVIVEPTDAAAAAIRLGEFDRFQLARELGIKPISVGKLLDELARQGALERSGTHYRVTREPEPEPEPEPTPAPEPERRPERHLAAVPDPEPETPERDLARESRDAALAMGRFTRAEFASFLQLDRPQAQRLIEELEDAGIISNTGQKWRNSPLMRYEPAKATVTKRERRHDPEADALRTALEPRRRGAAPVAGTGKGTRSGNTVVNTLLREVRRYPYVEVKRKSHKYSFIVNGREVASCSTTPGASGLGETRKRLRAAGIDVKAAA